MCKQNSFDSFYTNNSGYHDSTAGAALARIDREMKQKASGKKPVGWTKAWVNQKS